MQEGTTLAVSKVNSRKTSSNTLNSAITPSLFNKNLNHGLDEDEAKPKRAERKLISCQLNMDQLSSFLDHIIKVVNQHAKLLDTVS
jgi:hypothetical protein